MHVHLVFVTKYRRKVFTKQVLQELLSIFSAVCTDFESELVEMDGERDHIHLLITYPPKVALSRLVNILKGVSSRLIRKKQYPSIAKALWGGSLWSPSYFAASCGGAPLEIIRTYIEQQSSPEMWRRLTSRPWMGGFYGAGDKIRNTESMDLAQATHFWQRETRKKYQKTGRTPFFRVYHLYIRIYYHNFFVPNRKKVYTFAPHSNTAK